MDCTSKNAVIRIDCMIEGEALMNGANAQHVLHQKDHGRHRFQEIEEVPVAPLRAMIRFDDKADHIEHDDQANGVPEDPEQMPAQVENICLSGHFMLFFSRSSNSADRIRQGSMTLTNAIYIYMYVYLLYIYMYIV